MATLDDVKRLALKLPGVTKKVGGHIPKQWGASVEMKPKPKGFVWVWMERIDPKKARVPNEKVIAVRTADLSDKDMLLASDPDKFFTEPHYNGYAAVMVRLDAVTVKELEVILTNAWRCVAPQPSKAVVQGKTTSARTRRRTTAASKGRNRPQRSS
jgi:hypothetical protein